MRPLRLVAAAAACLLALAACPEEPPPPPPPPPPPVAQLVKTTGLVELVHDGGISAARAVAPLYAGDVVKTGPGASALLKGGPVEIELEENTIFPIGKALSDVNVSAGEVVLLSDADGEAFGTPLGTAGLSGGGRARLALRDGKLVLEVGVGEVELTDADGGTATASSGQRVRFGVGAVELEDITDPQERLRLGLGPVELEDAAPPPAVKAEVEAGRPLLKAPGAAKATPAPKSSTLAEGQTGFVTPKGAQLRLESSGLVLSVAPGASGLVDTPTRQGALVEVPVTLEGGDAALRLTKEGRVRLGGATPVTLSSAEANAELSASKAGQRLEVVAGSVEVAAEGQAPVTVRAGQAATVGPGGAIEVKPQPRSPLVVPFGKRTTVYNPALKELGLKLPARPVRVEVAADPGFTQVLASGEAEDQVTVRVPASRQLFWRFPGEDGAPVQGQVKLRAEPVARSGGVRGDVIAETGKKATVYYQGSVPPLTLTFTPVPEAKAYQLKVYAAGALTTPVFEKKSEGTKVLVESGTLAEGSYVWFASPLDANGRELAGGRMNQMELVFDNALTSLVITSPKDGAKVNGDVVASGTAPAGSRLAINGKPVALGASGRFSVPVGAVDVVVFALTTGDGGEGYWVRRVRR